MIPRNSNVALACVFLSVLVVLLCARAAAAALPVDAPRAVATAAATRGLAAPQQVSPANGAQTQGVPGFSWKPVRGADRYEFQLSADSAFRSIVLGQGRGSYQTHNTFATIDETLADGSYYWRVRAIDAHDRVGRWSAVRSIDKAWTDAPHLTGPVDGAVVTYPSTPLVFRWDPVPNAFKYRLRVATDPSLANSVLPRGDDVDTSGTVLALPYALAPGRYYWAVTPLDAEKHGGRRSPVAAFDWSWPTATATRVTDLDADARVFDPQFSWDSVPGAARYEVEVNPSQDFAAGSRVCCNEDVVGTSLSPLHLLPNNTYYWRVRALDVDGNAGSWNLGPSFTKTFDDVAPSIPGLRMRDNAGDAAPPTGVGGVPQTGSPVIAWDPVPGASSYEVTVAPWAAQGSFCNWTASGSAVPTAKTFITSSTAWAPLGFTNRRPLGANVPNVVTDPWSLFDGASYCVRVRARSDRDASNKDIVSDWTQLGGLDHAAFAYDAYKPPSCSATSMPADAYNAPQSGAVSTRMPLFTWTRVAGACGYFVVVARDADFTKIVDIAFTRDPAYAPRTNTYADETTSYYWAVMPTAAANGDGLSTVPQQDHPRAFDKRSVPPQLMSPGQGGEVTGQPQFRWTAAEGAREYRIQVAADPTFGDPIVDVVTDATAYTSSTALPADTGLYWRVRGDDENKTGLAWSQTGSFQRRLPIPTPFADNPLGGETIPVLRWSPVDGAISYAMHVEQVDGTVRDFTMRSSAFTPVTFYGTGVWRWQVRANFEGGARVVTGGFTPFVPFARRIATPAGLRASTARGGILLSWNPTPMATRYRVQIATSDSFATTIDSILTDNTSFAPKMNRPQYASGSPLYWRVATVDEGNNTGGWAASPLRNANPMRLRVTGKLRVGRSGSVLARVTDRRGKVVSGVRVSVAGAGLRAAARRTGRRGTVRFRLRPRAKAKIRFSADKRGYAPAAVSVRVR